MPAWTASLTSTAPTPGPAGLFYADVPNRVIAIIIDYIILGIVGFIISLVLYGILGNPTKVVTVTDPNSFLGVRFETQTNYFSALVFAAVNIVINGGYFIYTWTAMRGTLGMKVLGMQVGNQTDGASITMDQAIRRWLALGGIFALVQALANLPLLGLLVWLASIIWVIALLVTTAQSPTKQGLHDQFAGTMVVKAARSVA
jgi:uncharacterized RDD family membrane protein YckC